jgi:acetyl esterase
MRGDGKTVNASARRWWVWWSALTGGLVLTVTASSRSRALVLRHLLDWTAPARPGLAAPPGVASIVDEQYAPEREARLDVYFPSTTAARMQRPVVVWVHGGAWISGDKQRVAPYFAQLAAAGFTVVAVDYSLAPQARYPIAIRQINDALAYVRDNAERFHADCERLVLAGDSAGAQMASQIATAATNPTYAAELGIVPSVRAENLRGVALFCGAYDANAVARHPRPVPNAALRVFTNSVLRAYTGSRDRDSDVLREMSTIDHVTGAFPPTFISGGNGDPLTEVHSEPFAARLEALGVEVSPHFFAPDHEPELGHQYQFDIDTDDGRAALDALALFIERCTA